MSDAAVRELAGVPALPSNGWTTRTNHTGIAETLRRILAALSFPATRRRLAQSRRQLETSRLPPLITASTRQPFECRLPEKSRIGYGSLTRTARAELPVRARARRATARHRDAGLSRHRVRSRAHYGRGRAAALLHDRGHHTRGAPVGARGADLRPAQRRRWRHRRYAGVIALAGKAAGLGQTPSRSARCTPVCCRSRPFQPLFAVQSAVLQSPSCRRAIRSATLACERLMTPAWLQRRPNGAATLIDWRESARAKMSVFGACSRICRRPISPRRGNAAGGGLSEFRAAGGALLAAHALFEALHAADCRRGRPGTGAIGPNWRNPAALT